MGTSCVVGHYTAATIAFDSTPRHSQYDNNTFVATYGDEIAGNITYGQSDIEPPYCSMGIYPSTNHYVGEYCSGGGNSGSGGTVDATLDYNTQTVSGTMNTAQASMASSFEFACSFFNWKKSTTDGIL